MSESHATKLLSEFTAYYTQFQEVMTAFAENTFNPSDYSQKVPLKIAARRLGITVETLESWQQGAGGDTHFITMATAYNLIKDNERRQRSVNNGLAKKMHTWRRRLPHP